MAIFEPAVAFHLLQTFSSDELTFLQKELSDHLAEHQIQSPSFDQIVSLTRKIQAFQLSHNSSSSLSPIRIPTKLFKNTAKNGSLFEILKSAALQSPSSPWDNARFQDPAQADIDCMCLLKISENLQRSGHWKLPLIYFASSVPDHVRQKYIPAIYMMQGCVSDKMVNQVTHVIQGDDCIDEEDDRNIYFRTLEMKDEFCLLHYWFLPDSADVWVPRSSSEFSDPEEHQDHEEPFVVTVRWIKDTIKFREWMNEDDYEIDNPDELSDVSSACAELQTSHEEVQNEPINDILNTEELQSDQQFYEDFNCPDTFEATELNDDQDYKIDSGDEDIDGDNRDLFQSDNALLGHGLNFKMTQNDYYDSTLQYHDLFIWRVATTNLDRRLQVKVKRHEYEPWPNGVLLNISLPAMLRRKDHIHSTNTTPSSKSKLPAWFSAESVHEIESQAFHDIEMYTLIRNQILDIAHNSSEKVCIVDCCNQIQSDTMYVALVHAFLEYHNIINTKSSDNSEPTASSVADIPLLRGDTYLLLASTTPSDPEKLIYDQQYKDLFPSPPLATPYWKSFCAVCNADSSSLSYHCVKLDGFSICRECFVSGRYPSDFSSNSFVRLHGLRCDSEIPDQPTWSDEETLRLLDAIHLYGFQWSLVADAVQTKSKTECAEYFLQLPIGELPTSNLCGAPTNFEAADKPTQRNLDELKLLAQQIIGDAPNPLMSLIHLLSVAVQPVLASEAAHAAIQAMFGTADYPVQNSKHDIHQLSMTATVEALRSALDFADRLVKKDEATLEILVHELTELQLQRIQLKLNHLENIYHM
ncbi:hypothetical protein BDV3_001680 [Batrachochytrium dendrobatidis]|uniref:ZZ-type domain-containing protein n=2 Tax=Batrachochytrium dendrobatidis (strain JEL423) TaxID=403673 RepID=A0A177WSZ2_BATDL|nr:hypothetical protein BDEG_26613 [Batrachochytrium dendrobatidis JEL423]